MSPSWEAYPDRTAEFFLNAEGELLVAVQALQRSPPRIWRIRHVPGVAFIVPKSLWVAVKRRNSTTVNGYIFFFRPGIARICPSRGQYSYVDDRSCQRVIWEPTSFPRGKVVRITEESPMVTFTKRGQREFDHYEVLRWERNQLQQLNDLIASWQIGHRDAGETLYYRVKPIVDLTIRKHLNRRFQVRVAVEDMAQSIFLSLLASLRNGPRKFETARGFAVWVRKLARNKIVKQIMYETAHKRSIEKEHRIAPEASLEQVVHDGSRDDRRFLERTGRYESLNEVVGELEPICQHIVALMSLAKSQLEIAKELGVTTRTVRRKMARIRGYCQKSRNQSVAKVSSL